jgi:hypothetical protein
MSIATRRSPKRQTGSFAPSPFYDDPFEPVPAIPAARREAEAPERAADHVEAPETRAGRSAEAPEAGKGRGHYLEWEFTHGRSRS